MKRRRFLAASGIVLGAAGSGLLPHVCEAMPRLSQRIFLVDLRFPGAERALQRRIGSGQQVIPVTGDITNLWQSTLRARCRDDAAHLAGITTESVYFCLKHLIGARRSVCADVRRISRDLFEWEIGYGESAAA